ncbi:MAG: EAL domain-containing protein [Betaproteobacteria bacterium]|nr:EAL domain-containing protein [Betaproteobacteria bacterium]
MSLYRQLWISILASVLVALAASLFASLYNARDYLETQLSMKNQDNASAMALALSSEKTDRDDIVLALTALFDSGHYEAILAIGPDGKVLLEKFNQDRDAGAPAWFVHLLPIRSLPGQAQVSGGWRPLCNLTVMSRSSFAYRSLWETATFMSVAILGAGLLGGVLGSLVLRRIRRPMEAVIEQAQAINERRFVTIPEPDVPELRHLATAMNDTVNRLRDRFEEDARMYEGLRRVANFDVQTGLANREFFIANVQAALEAEDTAFGVMAIVRLTGLGDLNRNQGREATDDMIRHVGHAIGEITPFCVGTFAGRLSGGDFGLLLPAGCDNTATLRELLELLLSEMEPIAGPQAGVCIGYGKFAPAESPARLFSRIDAALASAESEGPNTLREAASDVDADIPVTAEDWRRALRFAMDGGNMKLAHHPIRLRGAAGFHREYPLRIRLHEKGGWLAAGRFVPLAERLGLMQELDLAAIELALIELAAQPEMPGLWVHLSAHSVADQGFQERLLQRLGEHPACAGRLWLEIPEAGALHCVSCLRDLVRAAKPLGVRVGLEHYGSHFNQIGLLYDIGLGFLKVDSGFIQEIDRNTGNQAFLKGLCEIAHQIGILVFAEGVETEAELAKALELGFDGMTGPGVGE